MQGKIIKGIAGFYYVHEDRAGTYECKARGVFRKKNIKPAVGDNVEFEVISEDDKTGNIIRVYPPQNELIRPFISNVDQIMLVFAVRSPDPNLGLLDRFLVVTEKKGIEAVICFNKTDLSQEGETDELRSIYEKCGSKVIFICAGSNEGADEVREILEGKTTALAGPSGVGKSTIMNMVAPEVNAATGSVSEKIGRGRHTTRHTELINIHGNTYLADTPGFTSLELNDIKAEDLRHYFREFDEYEGCCRYNGCVHVSEPGCAVKDAVADGLIHAKRYESYKLIYEELKNQRRY
ncbi:MAG: ribosome small subunit-dependent GTPase A [Lachnospiraceae bacterium]|nr:ribosome small subunit-dependent GTPase A [Lachnospiraceae bacterium]